MTRTSCILQLLGAVLLLPLFVITLHAQSWNTTLLWERTFSDTAHRNSGYGKLVADTRGHIHLLGGVSLGESQSGRFGAIYLQLLPNGDSVRMVRYVDTGMNYSGCVLRANDAAPLALALLRDSSRSTEMGFDTAGQMIYDTMAQFLIVRLDPSGWPVDTVVGPIPSGPQGRGVGVVEANGGFAIFTRYSKSIWDTPSMLTRFDSNAQPIARFHHAEYGGNEIGGNALCAGPHGGYYTIFGDTQGENSSICDVAVECVNTTGSAMSRRWKDYAARGYVSCLLTQSMAATQDSGVFTATNASMVNRHAATIARFDSSGRKLWSRLLDPTAGHSLTINACMGTPDGGALYVGSAGLWNENSSWSKDSLRQFYLLRVDDSGRTMWEWNYGSDTTEDILLGVTLAGDTIIVCGSRHAQPYVAKLKVETAGVMENRKSARATLRITPNPVGSRARLEGVLPHAGEVRLEVADLRGAVVRNLEWGVSRDGAISGEVDATELPAGRYLVRLLLDGEVAATATLVRE